MKSDTRVSRRGALKAGTIFAAGAAAVLSEAAGAQDLNRFGHEGPLDPKNRILLKGGTIVSMDEKVGDLVRGDLLIEGKKIAAIAPELGLGMSDNGTFDSVTVFDLKTLKMVQTVKAGENPDIILFEPTTKRVLSFNGKSKDATVIDAADGSVLGTIAVGGKPE